MTLPVGAMRILILTVMLIAWTTHALDAETVGDRLWIWAHASGVYNGSYLRDQPRKSTIEPIEAAKQMGIRNVMMIRYEGDPAPPFDAYYKPFREMDRVVWSLTGASGATSTEEREHVFDLARREKNVTGFILDDFFHGGGSPDDTGSSPWLAANGVRFPVTLTMTAGGAVEADRIEIVQSDWHSGDYRSGKFALEISRDGRVFEEVHRGVMPDEGAGVVSLPLPGGAIKAIGINILSTHDTGAAKSCGLSAVRLYAGDARVEMKSWRAQATSSYAGYDAAHVLTDEVAPFPASVTPDELGDIRRRAAEIGRPLSIDCVVYTTQISPRARAHLAHVDRVALWTWVPEDLDLLEENLGHLERLVPDKTVLLGCYLYDFSASKPLSLERMRMQAQLGFKWLQEGRIEGMIFLGTPVVDAELEAVAWTTGWIAEVASRPLGSGE